MNNSQGRCRLAVDVGGTFTDVALEAGGDESLVTAKVLTTPDAPEEGVVAAVGEAIGAAGIEPGEVDLLIHGHDPRHQRPHRAHRRENRPPRHRGVPGFGRDGPREPLRAVRHLHRSAVPPRAAASSMAGHGADELRGRGLGPSRRGLGAGAPPSLRATRRRGGRGRAAPLVREPRPRAAGGRDPRRRPAGSPHHPVERGVPRDPGVRAPVHGLRQRLRPAADVGLPHPPRVRAPLPRPPMSAPPHDLGRRPHHPRQRDPLPHPARRVGAGRGRDPRHRDRPANAAARTRSPSTWAAPPRRSASSTAANPR